MKKILAGALLSSIVAYPAFADVTYEEETKTSGIMKLLVRGQKNVTRISGDKMRVESDRDVQIIDVGTEKIYTLDPKKKTFSVMTFEEMRRRMEKAMAKASEATEESKREEGAEVSAKANIKVDETGNRQTIAGYACSQYLMEMALAMEDQKSGQQGELSTLSELWLTKEAPGVDEIHAFHMKMAQKLGTAAIGRQFLGGGNDQSNAFAANMQEMASEMRKLDGFTMRSVFYFGSPEAARKEALEAAGGEEGKEKKKGGGLGGFLKKMTPVPGGESEEGGEAGGGIVMKITTEVRTIDTHAVDASQFTVPDNYKQVDPE